MKNGKVGIGVIGCGGISKAHLVNIKKCSEMELIGLVDIEESRAYAMYEQFSGRYYTSDIKKVLNDNDIDAVIICTSHNTHRDLTLQACHAGKNVFCEKPPALTIKECREIQEAVKQTKVKYMTGWWQRYSPLALRTRDLIPEPQLIFTRCSILSPPLTPDDPYWRNRILDYSGYNYDLAYFLAGCRPIAVSAHMPEPQHANSLITIVRFESGCLSTSYYSAIGTGSSEKWTFECCGKRTCAMGVGLKELYVTGAYKLRITDNVYHNGFNEQMQMFADTVLGRRKSPLDAWEGSIPTILTEKALESAQTKQIISINLQEIWKI